jgi:RNA polymerase sigma-70 factor (ECF subfamily)
VPKNETYKNLTDEELIHRYRNSHETSYIGELYQRYTHLVFGVCMKYLKNETEAEDATMQIFEKLIAELKKHHIISFRPWLHMVAKNYCMMEFRKAAYTGKKLSEIKNSSAENVEMSEEEHQEKEKERLFFVHYLKEGIEELKEEQRTCIELFYLKDCSYSEIAAVTGFGTKDVKSYIQNGKRNLRNFIQTKNEQEQRGQSENL